MKAPVWVLICNPENRRQHLFSQALFAQYAVQPILVSYDALLEGASVREVLESALKSTTASHINIKIESPGESFLVEKRLIQLGVQSFSERLTPQCAANLPYDKGLFRYLKEWFLGFSDVLHKIELFFTGYAREKEATVHYLNHPEVIMQFMDKHDCQQILQNKGANIPELINHCVDFKQFEVQLRAKKICQVFVKARFGSSASGVMALRLKPNSQQLIARTTLSMGGRRGEPLYNSLKVKTYSNFGDVAYLYSAIMAEEGYVERWVPKPSLSEGGFDFRVVVIAGQAQHTVARCSKTPMSNLHLGNLRGDIQQHPQADVILAAVHQEAERVGKAFPKAHCFGADLNSYDKCMTSGRS
ncbi:MAG: STM4014 family protein [Methylococcales bacterium]|jgi:hypothetical protein|nr:STM4014 family protein [Methylococcales bacterium]MBT7443930.1 STM4014 family protein [Methylococcales bacterium]